MATVNQLLAADLARLRGRPQGTKPGAGRGPPGPAGTNGTNGTNGAPGAQGPAGPAAFCGRGGNEFTNGTAYLLPNNTEIGAGADSTENIRQLLVPAALNLSAFYVRNITGAAITTNCVLTVRKTGAATALTITFVNGDADQFTRSITGQAVAFAAGDLMSVEIVNGNQTPVFVWGIA